MEADEPISKILTGDVSLCTRDGHYTGPQTWTIRTITQGYLQRVPALKRQSMATFNPTYTQGSAKRAAARSAKVSVAAQEEVAALPGIAGGDMDLEKVSRTITP